MARSIRIERNREVYNGWPAGMQRAVSSGTIVKGMSAEMVRVAWGQPGEISTDPFGTYMYWLYPVGDKPRVKVPAYPNDGGVERQPAGGPVEIELARGEPASTNLVVFKDGQVQRVEQVKKKW